jgi:uncharacterized protein YaiL (DUF2058 family)
MLRGLMQNLRDKLLKAGLVTEDQAKAVERPPKKQQPSAAERQAQEAFRAREAELAEERRKEAAKQAEARMQSERARKLRALVEEHRLREPPGEVAFHSVKRSGKIGRVAISAETAKKLESGNAAVVDDPGSPDAAVVSAEAAKQVYAVDPAAIRFWSGPEKPIGFKDAGE